MKTTLGRNQRFVLSILNFLSAGRNIPNISYYGGSVSSGQRCISMGRECRLYYDVPWEVIDLRHAGKLFWMSEHQRLGFNTQKTFNRAIHPLIIRGILFPVSYRTVLSGEPVRPNGSRLRFVRLNVDYA